MVIKGDVTTGAIVSSVIVSGRISGIISNFSSTLISILSAEKTGKDLLSFFFDEDQAEKNTGITVNIKVQWRYLYPGRELSV